MIPAWRYWTTLLTIVTLVGLAGVIDEWWWRCLCAFAIGAVYGWNTNRYVARKPRETHDQRDQPDRERIP